MLGKCQKVLVRLTNLSVQNHISSTLFVLLLQKSRPITFYLGKSSQKLINFTQLYWKRSKHFSDTPTRKFRGVFRFKSKICVSNSVLFPLLEGFLWKMWKAAAKIFLSHTRFWVFNFSGDRECWKLSNFFIFQHNRLAKGRLYHI